MYENKKLGFLFVLPFVLGVLLFKLFPFVASLALSFTQYDLIDPPQYIGLDNYKELVASDPLFRKSLGVTLTFAVLAVPFRVGFALFIAHVLNFKLRGINFFRSAFYLPSILGGSIAVAVLWRFIFLEERPGQSDPGAARHGPHSLAGRRAFLDVDHRAAVHLAVRLGHGDLPGGPAERAGLAL